MGAAYGPGATTPEELGTVPLDEKRTGGGTSITWRSTFRAKVPGTGGIYRRELGKFIKQTVDGLAAAAASERARTA